MKNVKDVMSSQVHFCNLEDNLYEAALKMKKHDIGFVPVCDHGKVKGIITDRDLVIHGVAAKKPGSTKVSEIMHSGNIISTTPDMTATKAADLMAEHQIRRLPVLDNNDNLIGVVALGDLALNEQIDYKAGQALSDISEHRIH